MFKKMIPAFYWPAAVVLIDDNAKFLKAARRLFLQNKTHVFSEPAEGIQFLNENVIRVSTEKEFECNIEDKAKDYIDFLTIQNLYKKLNKPERFEEIALLIIDYKMPQGDGLFYIDQLKNQQLKKIFLTGVANNDQVVTAFNDRQIDRYVKKLGDDADVQLSDYANQLQEQYFSEASQVIMSENSELAKLLANSNVIDLFNEVIDKHNIREFYLLEESGSFLLVSYDEKFSVLALQTPQAKQDSIAGLRLGAEVTEQDLQPLVNNEKLITQLFINVIDEDQTISDYFFKAKPVPGTDLHYAIIEDVFVLDLEL